MSKAFPPTKPKSVSNKLGASTSSAKLKRLNMYSPFQFPIRQSWKPQRNHTAAPLPPEVWLEATRSLIHAGGGLRVASLHLGNRRKNDRLLRKTMRLLSIVNRVRAKMGTGEDLRPRAQRP